MNAERTVRMIAIAIAIAVAHTAAFAQNGKARIEGTWDVTLSVVGEELVLRERLTFAAGRNANEGTVVSTNELDSFACSAGQGAWLRTARREFATTHSFYCFDPGADPFGAPDGSATIRETVTVDGSGDTFAGRGTIEFFAPDGSSLGTTEFTVEGTRLRATPPAGVRETGEAAKTTWRRLRARP
jgi:hypothetical protein